MPTIKIHNTDALTMLRDLPDASVDALVTDPPSGIGFMGKDWDNHSNYEPQTHKGRDVLRVGEILGLAPWEVGFVAFVADVASECWRVLKPGAHGLVWALPRTADLTALGLRVARFEVRDSLHHIFGSGFPKSLDVGKAIDAAAGVEREAVGVRTKPGGAVKTVREVAQPTAHEGWRRPWMDDPDALLRAIQVTAPATPEARQWDGWGTALKPAHEVWWLIRKPLGGTVASNVLEWGTGALNVDGCRVDGGDLGPVQITKRSAPRYSGRSMAQGKRGGVQSALASANPEGRWPPNLLLTHSAECGDDCAPDCPVGEMGRQSSGGEDFFPCFRYEPKPSRGEREAGLDHFEARSGAEAVNREPGSAGMQSPRAGAGRTADGVRNHHPTVKPVALMRWLVRLVTPPGGTVLDPFVGSGTTAVACVHEGVGFVGSEMDPAFAEIARARVDHADPAGALERRVSSSSDQPAPSSDPTGQTSLF